MSLGSALQIGRSGLLANRAAIEVTGHNIANVSTPGYHRQTVNLTPLQGSEVGNGLFLGRGVQLENIVRQISSSLESRIRGTISDGAASQVRKDVLSQIEAIENEFTDVDLSTNLSEFFDAWSELANTPDDFAARTLVVEQGAKLASFIQDLRGNLVGVREQINQSLRDSVTAANDLLSRIAEVTRRIGVTEGGLGGANSLRDERDQLLNQLAGYMDISIVEHDNGMTDVFVGSTPLVLNGESRGLTLKQDTANGQTIFTVAVAQDGTPVNPASGSIAGLLEAREQDINGAIDALDDFARELIHQVNRIHTQGQGLTGFQSVTGAAIVQDHDAALNSQDAGLGIVPTHGSFQIHVTQTATGQRTASTINIDLDGIDADNDTTLNSLVAELNAIDGVNASITNDGKIKIESSGNGFELSFSDDTSGVLASLGVNTFFTGSSAVDVAVNSVVRLDSRHVSAAANHVPGDNSTAQAIAAMRTTPLSDLGGISITEMWNRHVEEYAVRLGQAQSQAQTDEIVRSNLESQQQSISGVNLDEEAINLLGYQRAYQGTARFLSVVDELMQTLMQLI
jgi:flagellar hook-associated protein 1 FlgK